MKRSAASLVCCAALSAALGATSSDLTVARSALGDGLGTIAVTHAAAAEEATTNADVRTLARLVQVEALAREGKAHELVALLRQWPAGTNELFRYWLAWGLARDHQGEEARHLLAAPFKEAATQALAWRLLARLQAESGDRAGAEAAFRQAAALLRGSAEGAENAVEWAQTRESAGDVKGALEILAAEKAMEAPGAAGESAQLLGASLLARLGRNAESQDLFLKLVSAGTNASESAFVLASCARFDALWRQGTRQEALQVISNAVVRARRSDLVCAAGYRQGFAQFEQKDLHEIGRTNLVALFRRFPGAEATRTSRRRYADALLDAGEVAAAVQEYGNLLQAYPEFARDPRVLESRGWAYLKAGLRVEASSAFGRAAQFAGTNAPLRARCLLKQGDALLEDRRYEEAAAAYARVEDPSLASRARYQKADALVRAGRGDDALADFRAVWQEGGAFAIKAGLRIASHEVSSGRPESAIDFYSQLLGVKSKRADAAILDDVESETNKVADAGGASPGRRPVLTPEQRVAVFLGRGRASYMAYRWTEAEADFSEVAKLQPAQADKMKFWAALCRYGAGRDAEAVATVRELLAATDDQSLQADLRFWLAKFDAAHGDCAVALKGFESCATNSHLQAARQLEAFVRAARCAVAIPDYAAVLDLIKRFMTRPEIAGAEVKDPAVARLLTEALLLQGEALVEVARFDEAILVLERVARLPDSDDSRRRAAILKANCLFAMGADDDARYREAIVACRVVLQDEHLTPSLRLSVSFKIGRALEKLRKFDEAADQYYSNVVMAFVEGTKNRQWFDADASALFARTVMMLADFYESRGNDARAANVLGYLRDSHLPAKDEAGRRIARLREKGNLE
ncbi:MAG: tol-pal system YbgF family protein [Kiritimatiellia bacterium]